MLTQLVTADLGPVSLPAPAFAPRHVVAERGHMWQWVGDGRELISLSVAVRRTRLGSLAGVQHHLSWEAREIRSSMDLGDQARETEVMVMVDGAASSSAADVDGRVLDADVRNRVIVTADGEYMHVTRALVRDTDAGRELAEAVTTDLRVQSWSMDA